MAKSRGYTNIPNEEFERSDIKGNNKLVYLCLLRFRNHKTGKANPSQNKLAEITGLGLKTINRCTQNLIDKNIINALKSKGINNEYSFNYQRQNDATTSVKMTVASNCPETSVKMTPELASKCPSKITNKNNSKIKKEKEKKKKVSPDNGLPDWLDKVVWEEWIVYRKGLGKKYILSPSTISKQLKRLEKYKSQHVEIINKTIERGWIGLVYPDDHKNFNNNNNKNGKIKVTGGKYADYAERLQRSGNQSGEG